MFPIAQVVCLVCISLVGSPYPDLSSKARSVRFTYELLGRNTHLLRLSTEYFFFDTDYSTERRMAAFAADFATRTCPRDFVFEERRSALPPVSPVLAKNFVFHCR